MTIATTTSSVAYTGNGTTTAFAVPFAFFAAGDLEVIERVVATGVETTKALTTDYTVSGGNGSTGTVNAFFAPASTVTWTIRRVTAVVQPVDLVSNSPFPAETVERAFDRATVAIQETQRDAARGVLVPKTETGIVLPSSVARASRLAGWDASGQWTTYVAGQADANLVTPEAATVAHTLAFHIGGLARPRSFGAAGDGVTDDTAAWVAAISSGKCIDDERGGTYRITGALPALAAGQRVIGGGSSETIIVPVGSFQLFTINSAGNSIENIQVNGALHTGGGTFLVDTGTQIATIRGITAANAYNLFRAQGFNQVNVHDVWAGNCRGVYTARLYGQGVGAVNGGGVIRGDVIDIRNFIASGNTTDRPIGLDWDGNVHTVYLSRVGFISGHGYGMRVRNTSAGTTPALLQASGLSLEYCQYGAYFEAGQSFDVSHLYSFGHTVGDGVNVAAAVAFDQVRLLNAYVAGNAGWGFNTTNQQQLAGYRAFSNTAGDFNGVWQVQAPSIALNLTAYWRFSPAGGGVVSQVYDSNDFDQFARSTNRYSRFLNGALLQGWQSGYSDFGVPPLLPTYTLAGLPAASSAPRGLAWCSNLTGGAGPVYSDGTNWRRFIDATVAS